MWINLKILHFQWLHLSFYEDEDDGCDAEDNNQTHQPPVKYEPEIFSCKKFLWPT